MSKIRVLIVDDSIFFRKFLADRLSALPNIEIAGFAVNALEAKYVIPQIKPDVVTLDVEMPGLSGTEVISHIMASSPVPIVMVSALNINVFEALSAGAVDFVKKPDANIPGAAEKFINELAEKISIARNAHFHKPAPAPPPAPVFKQPSKSVIIAPSI